MSRNTFNKKILLVCGGAGFIGSNFIRYIFSKYPHVFIIVLDKLTYSGNLDNLKGVNKERKYKFIKGDIADKKTIQSVFSNYKITHVINFAAETHVDRSIHVGALEFIQTNIEGVFNILEAVKASKYVEKYVQVSTDEVYGSLELSSTKKFKEDTAFAPNVPYAATKASGDLLCRAYFSTWNVPVIVTHCSNNFGSYQYPEKLIPFFILRMMENKKLPLYGDGKHVRDWLHVDDHSSALESCLLRGIPGEVYNIGAGNEMSNLEITDLILKYFKRDKSWLEFVSDRPSHDRRYSIDSTKIRRELHWKPKRAFKKAFYETIDWYMNNVPWIERVRQKTGVFNPHIDLWGAHKTMKRKLNPPA